MLPTAQAQDEDPLERTFTHPPELAKPRTWWHWVSGNVSKEGITADLEAMQRIGLGGAQIFTVDQSKLRGPVKFMSPEWRKLVQHAMKEAARLHLEISMEGCDGWSESGGPWVTPAESMQKVVWSERQVHGGKTVALDLPQPETVQDFYRDIALLAFPTPTAIKPLPPPDKITANDPRFDGAALLAHDSRGSTLAYDQLEGDQWVQLEYAQPVTFRSVRFTMTGEGGNPAWQVQISDDGTQFRRVAVVSSDHNASVEPTTTRFVRLFRSRGKAKSYRITRLVLGGARLPNLEARTGTRPSVDASRFVPMDLSPEEVVDPAAIVNLTGQREWQAPPGDYTVLRIGHTSTGVKTHPSTAAGLECDKFSATAVGHHLQNMFGPVLADSPTVAGNPFHYILLDSWEAGCENWTPDMAAQFARLRGYDPLPWLPTLSGVIIGSADLTQRFLWDFRRTQADLVAEMHYGTTQDFAHKLGNGTDGRSHRHRGCPPWPTSFCARNIRTCRWANSGSTSRRPRGWMIRRKPPAQHTSTARPLLHTESLHLDCGDDGVEKRSVFAQGRGRRGVLPWNQSLHLSSLCPPALARPQTGHVHGAVGHQLRAETNTWWEPGRAWIEYLTRCEAMLQAGRFTADLCYFYGEGSPNTVHHEALRPAVPEGFDYDVCNADALLNLMSVADGRIVLPDGMSYRVLVLPPDDRMSLAVLREVETLVRAGATVYGPKPLHSPSLTGYPQSDDAMAKLADELWGPLRWQRRHGTCLRRGAHRLGRAVDAGAGRQVGLYRYCEGSVVHPPTHERRNRSLFRGQLEG